MSRSVLSPVFLLILYLKLVRMCYNNSVTFLSTGYATSEDSPAGARDCSCIISTEVSDILLRVTWETSASFVTGCQSTRIKLIPTKGFKAELDCFTTQHNKYSISNAASLSQVLVKRMDYPVCLKYQVDNGPGKVTVTCQGDELPGATATRSTTALATSTRTPAVKTSLRTSNKRNSTNTLSLEITTTTKSIPTDVTLSNTDARLESTNKAHSTTLGLSSSSTKRNPIISTSGKKEMPELITTGISSFSSRILTRRESVTLQTAWTSTDDAFSTSSSRPEMEDYSEKIIAGSVIGSNVFIIVVVFIIVIILRWLRIWMWKMIQKAVQERAVNINGVENANEGNANNSVHLNEHGQQSEVEDFSHLYTNIEMSNLGDSDTGYQILHNISHST